MTRSFEYFNSLDIEREGYDDVIYKLEREQDIYRELEELEKKRNFEVRKTRFKYGTKVVARRKTLIRRVTNASKYKSRSLQRDDRYESSY